MCWEPIKKDMYEKLCIIYQSLVNEIFKGIEAIALESQKTPPDVVRFQNYQYMNRKKLLFFNIKKPNNYIKKYDKTSNDRCCKEKFQSIFNISIKIESQKCNRFSKSILE